MGAPAPMPPGPPLPRLVQTLGFMLAPAPFIDGCRRRYGDVVTFRTLFDPGFVMLFHPDAVKQVLRGRPAVLRAGEANAMLRPVVGDHSLLLLDDDAHMRERKLLLPPFHGERMRAYERAMRDATDHAVDSWPVDEGFPLLPSMRALTLEVIMRAVFGLDQGSFEEELKRRLRALIDPIGSRMRLLAMVLSGGRLGPARMGDFAERHRMVDELILTEIGRRRESPDLEDREDVLSMLLLARDEEGRPMTDAELRDELVTLLVAGHETTATALSWAFELLLRNPPELARLRSSLSAGEDAYLDAVVKETLRLRPVIAGIGRTVREGSFEVGGHVIPPGTDINPSIAGIHRRADLYPEPRAFRPERFLGPGAPDTYTWLPFGGGTRRCIGASFASFEMKTVIRRVLERAALEPYGRRPDRRVRRGVTFVPKRGVMVRQARPPQAQPERR